MFISTTDGKQYYLPDMCSYCPMDTAGNHTIGCPLSLLKVPQEVLKLIHKWQLYYRWVNY